MVATSDSPPGLLLGRTVHYLLNRGGDWRAKTEPMGEDPTWMLVPLEQRHLVDLGFCDPAPKRCPMEYPPCARIHTSGE